MNSPYLHEAATANGEPPVEWGRARRAAGHPADPCASLAGDATVAKNSRGDSRRHDGRQGVAVAHFPPLPDPHVTVAKNSGGDTRRHDTK